MSLPDDILTGTVTFGQAVSLVGGRPTSMTFTIKPTHDLVHEATGIQLLDFTETIEIAEGMPGSITLPFTDQTGFRDSEGNAFSNWAYQVTGQFRGPGGQSKAFSKPFQLPMGQSVVDFDLIPGGNISLPVTAPVARVTSVLGKTGALTVQDFEDAGIGGGGPTSVDDLTDASTVGKAVAKADTAAAARTALGNVITKTEAENSYVRVEQKAPTPFQFGAKANGIDDDAPAIQALLNSGSPVVSLPPFTYRIDSKITIPASVMNVVMEPGGVLKAGASMDTMVDTPAGTPLRGNSTQGLTLDANRLAQTCFYPRYFFGFVSRQMRVLNALGDFVICGDSASPEYSTGADFYDFDSDAVPLANGSYPAITPGSRVVYYQKSTDNHMVRGTLIGGDIGHEVGVGVGGCKFFMVHPWGHYGRRPTTCFVDRSLGSVYLDCLADSATYGWRLYAYNTRIIGGGVYANIDTPDNTMVGVKIESGSGYHDFDAMYFQGGGQVGNIHRILRDFDGDMSTSTVRGAKYANTTNVYSPPTSPVNVGAAGLADLSQLAIKSAAGQAREVSFQTGNTPRFRLRVDNTAESGSNAGSNLALSRFDDSGAYLGDAFKVDRRYGDFTIPGKLQGLRVNVTAKTASATLTSTDMVVLASGTGTVITLPTPTAADAGRVYRVKNVGTSPITITPTGATIDGDSAYILQSRYEAVDVITDGTNWSVH